MAMQLILNRLEQRRQSLDLRNNRWEQQDDPAGDDRDSDDVDEQHSHRTMAAEGPHPLHPIDKRREDQRDDPREDEQQQHVENVHKDECGAFADPYQGKDDCEPHERAERLRLQELVRPRTVRRRRTRRTWRRRAALRGPAPA